MTNPTRSPAAGSLAVARNPRYIALLAGVALLVLLVGALLRPEDTKQTPPVPNNELATLPELSQRKALRDMEAYVARQGDAVARSVVYLPALATSGLVWSRDSVLSVTSPIAFTSSHPALGLLPALLHAAPSDSAVPVTRSTSSDSIDREWGVVVARAPDGWLLTLAGLTGGRVAVRCGGVTLETLVFSAPLPVAFAGGGLFDLDGHLHALAATCDGQVVLVPLGEVRRALGELQAPAGQLWARYGIRFAPLDSTLRAALGPGASGIGNGLMVTEVWMGGPADRAGLRPGDVVTRAGDQLITRLDDLTPLLAPPAGTALRAQRASSGVLLGLAPQSARSTAVEVAPVRAAPRGLALTHVQPGSRAASAGLRPGDRIVQIGHVPATSADAVHRALADSAPTLIVYQRGSRRRGVVLR